MNREQKAQFVEALRDRLVDAPFVVLSDFKGSSVREMESIRRACEPAGIHFQVVKNTLCKRAISGTEKEVLAEHFKGNIAIFVSGEDPGVAAKLYKAQAKENKKLELRAAFFEGQVLDESGVEMVASLPSREELLATLLQTLLAAPRNVMGVIKGPGRDLVNLLRNFAAKLEEQG